MDIYVYFDGTEYSRKPCDMCEWHDITLEHKDGEPHQYLAIGPCPEHRESVSVRQAERLLTGQ